MFKLKCASALIFLSIAAQAGTAEDRGHPVTHEDVWLMNRLDTPVVSPDGSRLVVSVSEPSYEKDGTRSDLWLVEVDGKQAPTRLTDSPEPESDVDWSPDGRRIAFSAARVKDEAGQVYVLNMVGPGEAIRITNLSTGASKPKWSPDGQRIAFQSRVYPGAADDAANAAEKKAREERGYNASVYTTFPIRQWDSWRDDLQTHLFIQDAIPDARAKDLLFGSDLVRGTGFGGIESLSTESLEPAWAPDGKSVIISATMNLSAAAYAPVRYQLYQVPVDGGEPRQITRSDDWSCHSARFSKNGKALYCLIEPHTAHVYELTDVARFDWSADGIQSTASIITESLDRPVNGMDISPDGGTVYVTAYDTGRVRIFAVPARGGKVTALNADSSGVYAGVTVAGRHLVARWEDSVTPAEIVRVDRSNGARQPLTAFNTERASALDRQPFREFWFENADGRQVHSFLALPPNFDESKKYPLVLAIHGGPFSSSLDADHVRWSPHLLAAPGYVVLMTDYTGSIGYGEAFSQAIEGVPLRTPGQDVVKAADEAIARFPFVDGERQAATGASYGGHIVNWLQATTTRFKALVGHAGLVDLEGQYASSDTVYNRERMNRGPAWADSPVWSEQSPSSYVGNFSTPILLTIGEKDFRVPINQTIAAWTYVQRMQVPGRLLVFHDANHWIMNAAEARYYWDEVHQWLAGYLHPVSDQAN